MTGSNSHITILTLNVNRPNAPIKRHRLANWIKSQDQPVCCIQKTHLTCKDTHRIQKKGMEKHLPSKWKAKQKKQGLQSWYLTKQSLNQQRSKETKSSIT